MTDQIISPDVELATFHCQLGSQFLESGRLAAAESEYQKAIAICPGLTNAYLGYGALLLLQNQPQQAINTYEKALEYTSTPEILSALGLAWLALGNEPQGYYYLGLSASYSCDYQTAINYYNQYLANCQEYESSINLEVKVNLANCYQRLNQYNYAAAIYRGLIDEFPQVVELYVNLILSLSEIGEIAEAITMATVAVNNFPDQIYLKFAKLRLLPIIYNTTAEIFASRQGFAKDLNAIIEETSIFDNATLQAVGEGTNFYLQYQGDEQLFKGGLSEKNLQRQYGNFLHRVMVAHYPQWREAPPPRRRAKSDKIRVGYICSFLQWHTVGNLFLGWVKNSDRQKFQVYCYYTGQEADQITDLYQQYSEGFYHIYNNIEQVSQQIYSDRLDILVFLELGMCPQTLQIAGLKLAPIYCATWGHPATTGLPTIDYFISAELLEPAHAETYYNEHLICLPNLGIYLDQPSFPPLEKSRSDWQISAHDIIYLSCQSLFKYLPQYDDIYGKIAERVNQAKFVFISHWYQEVTAKFQNRLYAAFDKLGLSGEDYCLFLPRLNYAEYLQLQSLADVGLDTFQFTGFATTLDAIAANLPLVTHEGTIMRSRQSAGILRRLGVTETIAYSESEYIEIAVKLGLDHETRTAIKQKIKNRRFRLYNDLKCIEGLEEFYQTCVPVK
ncbi:tetratricopeptide repeat protein [Limnospira fusiformis KN01]|uniref:tetratricopeptide repeat protein n=1 Tax=Limnospira TaxID=2596745 RepID=UPI0016587A67|nr:MULTISPECIES: glycosyltransferase family 41 protein [Limnospira]MDT9198494.1 tetratricopeptide repeat protein [Limnospira sp. PMC 1042.18]ULB47420.1 tetratricopeptide repeat protein [Limnospira fusiformis KN01]